LSSFFSAGTAGKTETAGISKNRSGEGVSMSGSVTVLLIITIAIILFIQGKIPLAVTGLGVIAALIMTRVLTVQEAFAGFSNQVTLLILFMAPVGEALIRSGAGRLIGIRIIRMAGGSERKLVMIIMLLSLFMSALTTNTGTVLALLPIVISVSVSFNIPRERLLIPLAFASAFGGVLTLIGASPNILINSFARDYGIEPFGFFTFAKVGGFIAAGGMLYMYTIGIRQLSRSGSGTPAGNDENSDENNDEKILPDAVAVDKRKVVLSSVILGLTVLAMMSIKWVEASLGLSLAGIAMIGSMFTVITGCLTMKEFYRSVSWDSVILFAALIVLGHAMTKTGAAEMVSLQIIRILPADNFYLVTAVVFLIGGLLAQFMSHTAAVAILAPIFLTMANTIGMNPRTVLMALCLSTGIAVATPIGTPPNVIVYHHASYKFSDFVKTGGPVFIISWIIGTALLPVFFPF
jgi:solute carrier family 13 (sodium-dependent dicarboxylate transporter), member 2/3/5